MEEQGRVVLGFSEFGAKGITQSNDYQYYYLQNLRVKGSAKRQDI